MVKSKKLLIVLSCFLLVSIFSVGIFFAGCDQSSKSTLKLQKGGVDVTIVEGADLKAMFNEVTLIYSSGRKDKIEGVDGDVDPFELTATGYEAMISKGVNISGFDKNRNTGTLQIACYNVILRVRYKIT